MINPILPADQRVALSYEIGPSTPALIMLQETFRAVFARGTIDIEFTHKMDYLLHLTGPTWFCQNLVMVSKVLLATHYQQWQNLRLKITLHWQYIVFFSVRNPLNLTVPKIFLEPSVSPMLSLTSTLSLWCWPWSYTPSQTSYSALVQISTCWLILEGRLWRNSLSCY